jgi:hypothetical protein
MLNRIFTTFNLAPPLPYCIALKLNIPHHCPVQNHLSNSNGFHFGFSSWLSLFYRFGFWFLAWLPCWFWFLVLLIRFWLWLLSFIFWFWFFHGYTVAGFGLRNACKGGVCICIITHLRLYILFDVYLFYIDSLYGLYFCFGVIIYCDMRYFFYFRSNKLVDLSFIDIIINKSFC